MSDTVAAYWGPREEAPDQGAARLEMLFEALAKTDPSAQTWFARRSSAPRPEDAADTTAAALAEQLARGRNRRDTDGSEMTELGYRLSLWNGDNERPVEMSALVGSTTSTPGVVNSVVLKVPSDASWRAAADVVFPALVEATTPDRASWMTRGYRRTQPTVDGVAIVGWQTYLNRRLAAPLADLPAGVTAHRLGGGLWLTVGDEPGGASEVLASVVAGELAR